MINNSPDNLNGLSLTRIRIGLVKSVNHFVPNLLFIIKIFGVHVKDFQIALLNVAPVISESFALRHSGSNTLIVREMLFESVAEVRNISGKAFSIL